MRKNSIEASDNPKQKSVSESGIDYTPKTYPLRAQIIFGAKLFGFFAVIFLLFWLFNLNGK